MMSTASWHDVLDVDDSDILQELLNGPQLPQRRKASDSSTTVSLERRTENERLLSHESIRREDGNSLWLKGPPANAGGGTNRNQRKPHDEGIGERYVRLPDDRFTTAQTPSCRQGADDGGDDAFNGGYGDDPNDESHEADGILLPLRAGGPREDHDRLGSIEDGRRRVNQRDVRVIDCSNQQNESDRCHGRSHAGSSWETLGGGDEFSADLDIDVSNLLAVKQKRNGGYDAVSSMHRPALAKIDQQLRLVQGIGRRYGEDGVSGRSGEGVNGLGSDDMDSLDDDFLQSHWLSLVRSLDLPQDFYQARSNFRDGKPGLKIH